MTWQRRPFPDANLLLLGGRQPAQVSATPTGRSFARPGTRRIFAFALMIRDGIPTDEVEPYLYARAGLADAARLLNRTPEALAAELVDTMLRGGAIVLGGGRLPAAAEHTPVPTGSLRVPFPAPGRQRHRQERDLPACPAIPREG